ncbi:Voltage-dependent T-type calcium channel subunit alpha-1G [Melipona quadrifasciata]|uniref:Voltage-dependent T-type calcium channel subunit alpha-1G n=1 Tax=Melipona quadrifasciata TaxID=166423 RepID=A0A0M8ZWZ6_9HYME|nr:Voltage-dependent T-type calcium channel subunit alpha-1G [Melipona quadrifasciata]
MLLKIIAEGPFGYISNGFNVFDGVVVVLSILGMNLFGCKFCETMKGSSDVECDRKNFDSLLWAIVTVFQVPTKDTFPRISRGLFFLYIAYVTYIYIYIYSYTY